MIVGDMNFLKRELDGCENENGRMMKGSMNGLGLHILNCVWDWLREVSLQRRRSLH